MTTLTIWDARGSSLVVPIVDVSVFQTRWDGDVVSEMHVTANDRVLALIESFLKNVAVRLATRRILEHRRSFIAPFEFVVELFPSGNYQIQLPK